jgi:hypothetical protein
MFGQVGDVLIAQRFRYRVHHLMLQRAGSIFLQFPDERGALVPGQSGWPLTDLPQVLPGRRASARAGCGM